MTTTSMQFNTKSWIMKKPWMISHFSSRWLLWDKFWRSRHESELWGGTIGDTDKKRERGKNLCEAELCEPERLTDYQHCYPPGSPSNTPNRPTNRKCPTSRPVLIPCIKKGVWRWTPTNVTFNQMWMTGRALSLTGLTLGITQKNWAGPSPSTSPAA